jgi:hypothetical protein
MATADQVVVELEARVQQYVSDIDRAESRFRSAAASIGGSAVKMQTATQGAFKVSAAGWTELANKSTTSITAINASLNGYQKNLQKLNTPLGFRRMAQAELDEVAKIISRSSNVLSGASTSSTSSAQPIDAMLRANMRSATSIDALRTRFMAFDDTATKAFQKASVSAEQFSNTIKGMPTTANIGAGMKTQFESVDVWAERALSHGHNLQFSLGNIAAQFNDIGVTAAAGMSPMIIGLQQGTQLAQAFAGQKLSDVAKGIGVAFASVLSPVSLLTIGLVAGGAALIQWAAGAISAGSGAATLEDMLKTLDESVSKVSDRLAILQDSEPELTFGSLTDEVTALTEVLLQLDRAAELKNLSATIDKIVEDAVGPSIFQKFGKGLEAGIIAAGGGYQAAGTVMSDEAISESNYDKLRGGKGLSYDQFTQKKELIDTAAAAGDLETVLAEVKGLFSSMAEGGPITSINSELLVMLSNLSDAALGVAKVEARFNGTAEAAKSAKAFVAEERAASQAYDLAQTEADFGAQSIELAEKKREIEAQNLELRLASQGLDAAQIESVMTIVEETENLSALTAGWLGILEGVARAKEMVLQRAQEITELGNDELRQAEQALALAQAEAVYGADSAQYAKLKNDIDTDNLRTQLEAKGLYEAQVDAIIAVMDETNNVIAATSSWQAAMEGVRGALAGIMSDLASIGGGLIAGASKNIEIAALKAGKTRAQAAREALNYTTSLENKAELMGANPIERMVILGKQAVASRNQQLQDTLDVERSAAAEREKSSGGGGRKGGGGGVDKGDRAFERLSDQTEDMLAEAEALNALGLGYAEYGDVLESVRKKQELLNAIQEQGTEITPEITKQVDTLVESYMMAAKAAEEARERHEEYQQNLDEFRSTAEDAFIGAVKGTHSLADALDMLKEKLLDMALSNLFENIFGGMFGGGGGGGGAGAGGGGILGGILGLFGFASGGYTGAGGKNQPAGIVHKGEVVWSQNDVAAAGGVAAVEAMRKGYANGGVVGMPSYSGPVGMPASSSRGSTSVPIEIVGGETTISDNGAILTKVRVIAAQSAAQASQKTLSTVKANLGGWNGQLNTQGVVS